MSPTTVHHSFKHDSVFFFVCSCACVGFPSSGVFENAFSDPMVWLTALLACCVAVLPSMAARALNVVLKVHDKHKVRRACKIKALGKSVSSSPSIPHRRVSSVQQRGLFLDEPPNLSENPD